MLGAVPSINTRGSAPTIGPKLQTSGALRLRFAMQVLPIAMRLFEQEITETTEIKEFSVSSVTSCSNVCNCIPSCSSATGSKMAPLLCLRAADPISMTEVKHGHRTHRSQAAPQTSSVG